jgi:hypothetical protein
MARFWWWENYVVLFLFYLCTHIHTRHMASYGDGGKSGQGKEAEEENMSSY